MVLEQQQARLQQQMSKQLWQRIARGSPLQLYMQHYSSSSSSRMRRLAAWGWMLLLKHWQQMQVATCRVVELLPLG
jgi:hypothetical protein